MVLVTVNVKTVLLVKLPWKFRMVN